MNKNMKILIIGLGLIGGSYAEGLTKKGYSVYAIDNNQKSIEYGIKNNLIIENKKEEKELINDSDLIILSLYPSDNVNWIKNNKEYFKDGLIITDVSGIKMAIVEEIQSLLTNAEFINIYKP